MNKETKKAEVSYGKVEDRTPNRIRHGEVPELNGYTEIRCHLTFDIKMDFTQEAIFVANGSMTDTPVHLCYLSVVSRDSVRLAFIVATFNDLDVFAYVILETHISMLHARNRSGLKYILTVERKPLGK